MIVNEVTKQMEMEPRDWKYVLQAYLIQYKSITKSLPEKVIFPMFTSIENIPVEWVPEMSEIAVTIIRDGSNIPEVTPEEEAAINQKDGMIKEIKQLDIKQSDRKPRLPPNPIANAQGLYPDGLGSRTLDQRQVAADLREKDIDENKQKPIDISKDDSGNRVIRR
jgi:hypothetical protein